LKSFGDTPKTKGVSHSVPEFYVTVEDGDTCPVDPEGLVFGPLDQDQSDSDNSERSSRNPKRSITESTTSQRSKQTLMIEHSSMSHYRNIKGGISMSRSREMEIASKRFLDIYGKLIFFEKLEIFWKFFGNFLEIFWNFFGNFRKSLEFFYFFLFFLKGWKILQKFISN
jgi:hypothetical protein